MLPDAKLSDRSENQEFISSNVLNRQEVIELDHRNMYTLQIDSKTDRASC